MGEGEEEIMEGGKGERKDVKKNVGKEDAKTGRKKRLRKEGKKVHQEASLPFP